MNVFVIGMGEVGRHITSVLVHEQHNVTIVDQDPDALARAEESFDVMTLRAHGASEQVLEHVSAGHCDLFLAMTNNSEVNLISAIRAREAGAKMTIARAHQSPYFEGDQGLIRGFLGIDLVIDPRAQVAHEIHKIVRAVSAISIHEFADDRIEVIQLTVDNGATGLGTPLKSIDLPEGTLVVAIVRDDELIIPGGNDSYHVGDDVHVIGLTDQMAKVEEFFGRKRKKFTRKAMIVGGGRIGLALARRLENDGVSVVLIDRDKENCQQLAQELHRTVILNGDGTDAHLLEEEGVNNTDVFIAVSMEDEVNLMSTLLAKDLGAPRCVALVHKPDYTNVCERLGIDVTISPRLAVAKQVLKYVREGQVLSVSRIMDGEGEFLEFLVPKNARITGVPLRDVNFPRGAVVCAGLGQSGPFIPRGDHALVGGDRVVVFTTPTVRSDIERLFRIPWLRRP